MHMVNQRLNRSGFIIIENKCFIRPTSDKYFSVLFSQVSHSLNNKRLPSNLRTFKSRIKRSIDWKEGSNTRSKERARVVNLCFSCFYKTKLLKSALYFIKLEKYYLCWRRRWSNDFHRGCWMRHPLVRFPVELVPRNELRCSVKVISQSEIRQIGVVIWHVLMVIVPTT